ncbi:unnamed protein product, partial [Amoebophrya sp. A120]|eukprot:GSA120T00018122001.1
MDKLKHDARHQQDRDGVAALRLGACVVYCNATANHLGPCSCSSEHLGSFLIDGLAFPESCEVGPPPPHCAQKHNGAQVGRPRLLLITGAAEGLRAAAKGCGPRGAGGCPSC